MRWLCERVGAPSPHTLTFADYVRHHGGALIMAFGGSPQGVLDSLSPGFGENLAKRVIYENGNETFENDNEKVTEEEAPLRRFRRPRNSTVLFPLHLHGVSFPWLS